MVAGPFARRPREDRLASRLTPLRMPETRSRPADRPLGEVAEVLQDALLPLGIVEFPLEARHSASAKIGLSLVSGIRDA